MKKCAWKAYAHKALRLKEPSSDVAEQGKESHEFWQQILAGLKSFTETADLAKYPLTKTFVRKALDMEEIGTGGVQFFEPHFAIDEQGLIAIGKDEGMFHGYLDRVVFFGAGENKETQWFDMREASIYVEDLKTGVSTQDDPTERHGYICLVKAAFPDCNRFTFARLFCKKGVRHKWDYIFSNGNKNLEIINHQNPHKNELMRITARSKVAGRPGANPLFNWLFKLDLEIQKTVESPNPGKHCEKWYGSPCFFLGKECPLAANMPIVAADLDERLKEPHTQTLLIKLLNMKDPSTLQQWEVNKGFGGVMQLDGFVKKIKDSIKAWSKVYGPIRVGDSDYGWAESFAPVIDNEKALTAMVMGDMDVKDIARAISITQSSLSKAPRGYADIIDKILHEAPAMKKSNRFGPLEGPQSYESYFAEGK